jgi:hypothetical protein
MAIAERDLAKPVREGICFAVREALRAGSLCLKKIKKKSIFNLWTCSKKKESILFVNPEIYLVNKQEKIKVNFN